MANVVPIRYNRFAGRGARHTLLSGDLAAKELPVEVAEGMPREFFTR